MIGFKITKINSPEHDYKLLLFDFYIKYDMCLRKSKKAMLVKILLNFIIKNLKKGGLFLLYN